MNSVVQKRISIFFLIAVLNQIILPSFAQTQHMNRKQYDACYTKDEKEFKIAIRSIIHKALMRGTSNIDYKTLVHEQWRAHKLDDVLDAQIDSTMLQIKSETSWKQLLQSLTNHQKATELAIDMAERVYLSRKIKKALIEIVVDVRREIGDSLEFTAYDAKQPSESCLHAFLGRRYGQTVTTAIVDRTILAFNMPFKNLIAQTNITSHTTGAISGAVVLLFRRQLSRITKNLGHRMVGAILGRLVTAVAGGIGLALITKDVWDLRYGVLPMISEKMKSSSTKLRVKNELEKLIKAQIYGQLEMLSNEASIRIMKIWHDFKIAHLEVLKLIETIPKFREFVEAAPPDQLARIDEIVSISLIKGDKTSIGQLMVNGSLHRAVSKLPEIGLQIAREKKSIQIALSWWDIAGKRLHQVVDFGVHKKTEPDTFTPLMLQKLLDFNDHIIISRLAGLPQKPRVILMDINFSQIAPITRGMKGKYLMILYDYLINLKKPAREELLNILVKSPEIIHSIATYHVRWAIKNSNDQLAAIKIIFRRDNKINFKNIAIDLQSLWLQKVNPVLLVHKYFIVLILSGFCFLFFFLVLRRILTKPGR